MIQLLIEEVVQMNKDLEKIDKYYLGFIQLDPTVYDKEKARRMIDDINYDPFCEVDILTGMLQGIIVLLRKEGNIFYDEYSSRYKNEIKLHLGKTNQYGIRLSYVKKFNDIYTEDPVTLIKEDVEKDYLKMYELLFEHEYYISHSKLDKSYVPVIIDEEKMLEVREEYFELVYRKPLSQEKIKK